MKFSVITFGCRANKCDAEWISAAIRDKGHEQAVRLQEADIVIVNACTVTAEAARQARQAIRRARKQNPHAIIVAAGCAVQAEPARFLSMPELDYTADMAARSHLAGMIEGLLPGNAPQPLHAPENRYDPFFCPHDEAPFEQGRARAVLKIQDGCPNNCTYCIVTKVRGDSRSMPTVEIIDHLKRLKKLGHGEVVLTGISLASWGQDLLPSRSLGDLLKVIGRTKKMPRIRLSSIDPAEISTGLMNMLAADNGICPHLHIPIQSGDDEILKAMGRRYTAREAGVRIRLLRQAIPDMAIGLDVIVGFPGETDEHFKQTLETFDNLPFDYLHVFPFSPRPGTVASTLPDKVPHALARERGRQLREMGSRRRNNFWRGQLGTMRNTIIESPARGGKGFRCRTDNYIPVVIGPGNWTVGEILPVRLVSVGERMLKGEVAL